MQTDEQNSEQNQTPSLDHERARTVLKRFFEFARNEERGATRQEVLHGMLARMAQEIVRLEVEMEAQETLWAQSLNEEHEHAYHEGYADGRRSRFIV